MTDTGVGVDKDAKQINLNCANCGCKPLASQRCELESVESVEPSYWVQSGGFYVCSKCGACDDSHVYVDDRRPKINCRCQKKE